MALIYCGIDEAGYGPMLGPLCVGRAVVRINQHAPDDNVPDLWNRLAASVCRSLKEHRAGDRHRIPIADSKKLKLANQSIRRHPLIHLERGVLAALATAGCAPADDDHLLATLGTGYPSERWYRGDPIALPMANPADALAIDVNLLRKTCVDAGVTFDDLACRIIGETEFNETYSRYQTKAAITAGAVARHIRGIAERYTDPADTVRIVCDRLGARASYAPILERALPGRPIAPIAESPDCSAYRVGGSGGEIRVLFMTAAESAHLPVALASMAAKLVRELAMARFNRAFGGERPELRPTAGYVSDARRWLAEVKPSEELRRRLVRLA